MQAWFWLRRDESGIVHQPVSLARFI